MKWWYENEEEEMKLYKNEDLCIECKNEFFSKPYDHRDPTPGQLGYCIKCDNCLIKDRKMEFDKKHLWHNREDVVGKTFNYLTVIKDLPNKNGKRYLLCRCVCGKEIEVYKSTLTGGLKKSCGCRRLENHQHLKSGSRKDNLYRIYAAMKNRCLNNKTPRYEDYGGRGIKICNEWLDDYSNFHDWAFQNGYSDGKNLSIERKDVNGNYCPENCCFIPRPEQNRNKRNSRFVTINNKTMILADWCRVFGISSSLVLHRIGKGMSEEQALTTPVK